MFDKFKNVLDKASPFPKAKSAVENVIQPATEVAVGEIQEATNASVGRAKDEISAHTASAKHEISDAVPVELNKAVEKAREEVEKIVWKAVELALVELEKGVLKKALAVIDASVPDLVSIQIGPITLFGIRVREKLDAVKRIAQNPPKDAAGFKQAAADLSPASVNVTLSGQLALLIVSSESLSVGMTLTWEPDRFLDRIEALIKELI